MKKANTKKKSGMGRALAVGAGVAAGAAAYMLVGPKGKQNRAKVKKFVKNVAGRVKNNKDVLAMAAAVKGAAKRTRAKAKGAVTKARSAARAGVKKGVGAAKKAAKKVLNRAVSKVKRVAR